MQISVQYMTMIVRNMDASLHFYRDLLGFQESYRVEPPGGGRITILRSSDGAAVELIEHPDFPVGLYSVGTDVDDLDAALEQLAAQNIRPEGPVTKTTVGRMAFITDPDGIRVCLIEHDPEFKPRR
ncbi:MAG: VOC family protein [Anaerovoracaceae bacterium]|jgi:lactoylglutathione lyase